MKNKIRKDRCILIIFLINFPHEIICYYIGGSTKTSLLELHDMRFVIATDIEATYSELRKSWWGDPNSLHIDCWGELKSADGYNIHIRDTPSQSSEKLYFINLGGYDPLQFTELHENTFIVSSRESKAKALALKKVLNWQGRHKDYVHEIEKASCINDLVQNKSFYIHLEKTDNPTPFSFVCKYTPLKTKS